MLDEVRYYENWPSLNPAGCGSITSEYKSTILENAHVGE